MEIGIPGLNSSQAAGFRLKPWRRWRRARLRRVGVYLTDICERLRAEQQVGLELLFGKTHADRARAIALIDANLTYIERVLVSFPDDVYLHALRLDPDDPGAVNGKGNVLFYEGKLDEAIMHHECAIKLAGGSYPAAEHDLNLVMRVKSGAVPFPE
jgi:tetratricopeptide (TPR) repeat protein